MPVDNINEKKVKRTVSTKVLENLAKGREALKKKREEKKK